MPWDFTHSEFEDGVWRILYAPRVRKLRNYVLTAGAIDSSAKAAAKEAERLRPLVQRASRRAKAAGSWDEQGKQLLMRFARARFEARERERYRERHKGGRLVPQTARRVPSIAPPQPLPPRRVRSAFDLAREKGAKLTHERPSYSISFLRDVLLPLWRILRPREEYKRGRPLPPLTTAKLIHEICRGCFEPEVVKGLNPDAIRARVLAHLKKP